MATDPFAVMNPIIAVIEEELEMWIEGNRTVDKPRILRRYGPIPSLLEQILGGYILLLPDGQLGTRIPYTDEEVKPDAA